MTLRKQIVKGFIWAATRNWGRQLATFIIFIVLSRLLEPKAFGLVAIASVFTAFVERFLDLGLSDAIVQRANLEPEHLDTAFWTSFLIGALMTGGSILAAPFIADFFKEPSLTSVIRWLSVSFLIGSLSTTQIAILRRQLAFKSLALRSISATIVGGIVSIGLAYTGFGIWSLVAQNLITILFSVIVLWSVSNWRPGFRFSKKHFRDLFVFGLNIVGIEVLDFFNKRTDDFLIGYFLGATLLGYYTIAYRLLLVMVQLLTGITTAVIYPVFARLQDKPDKMRSTFYQATQYTSLIAFPAFLGMLILAPELTLSFFGEKWLPSVPVMQILAFIGLLHSVSLFNVTVMKASGKPSWWLAIMGLTAICNVAGFLYALRWGIQGVAAAYVIVGYLLSPIALFAVHKLIKINFKIYFSQYVIPLAASLAMMVAVIGLKFVLTENIHPYLRLFLYVLGGSVTYFLVIQLIAQSISREILALIRLALSS